MEHMNEAEIDSQHESDPIQASESWSVISPQERAHYAAVSADADIACATESDGDKNFSEFPQMFQKPAGDGTLGANHGIVRGSHEGMESEVEENDPELVPESLEEARGNEPASNVNLSSSRVHAMVSNALFSGGFVSDAKLPWEKSPIFAEDLPLPSLKYNEPFRRPDEPKPTVANVATVVNAFEVSQTVFAKAIAGKKDDDLVAERQAVLAKAARTWAEVCVAVGDLCELGAVAVDEERAATGTVVHAASMQAAVAADFSRRLARNSATRTLPEHTPHPKP